MKTNKKKEKAPILPPPDSFITRHPIWALLLRGLLVNIIVEALCRRSVIAVFMHIAASPYVFIYNSLIIALSYSLIFVTRRRAFTELVVSTVWIGLTFANFVLIFFRTTPLSAIDLALLPSVWSIMFYYLKTWQIVGIALIILAVLALIVVSFRKVKRFSLVRRQMLSLPILGGVVCLVTLFLLNIDILPDHFENLVNAYADNGFVYCFSRSFLDRGVDEPENYSAETVEEIVDEILQDNASRIKIRPNIVFVQLESFFDPSFLTNLQLNENPIPVFTSLRDKCPSGLLTVPVFGGGTVNTEFEVLTGMSVRDFGTGEYPYHTMLQSTACESMCYNLRTYGYTSHAIHNNTATFYNRNLVYSNLGFDTFTSLEYMNGVTFTPTNWAKDDVLTDYVISALHSTASPDFVEVITVQTHGSYPDDVPSEPIVIDYDGFANESIQSEFDYYLTQLKETDTFIGNLVSALSSWPEPVMLVLYGDHLPNFDITDDMLDSGSTLITEYVIWSNYNLNIPDRDLSAWQLSSHIMNIAGYDEGILVKLHQNYSGKSNYLEALKTLEYDMLYGEKSVYGGVSPYEPTKLHMGLSEIKVDTVSFDDNTLFVQGHNFTPSSAVCINGNRKETLFISPSCLSVANTLPKDGDRVSVVQLSNGAVVGETNSVLWEN